MIFIPRFHPISRLNLRGVRWLQGGRWSFLIALVTLCFQILHAQTPASGPRSSETRAQLDTVGPSTPTSPTPTSPTSNDQSSPSPRSLSSAFPARTRDIIEGDSLTMYPDAQLHSTGWLSVALIFSLIVITVLIAWLRKVQSALRWFHLQEGHRSHSELTLRESEIRYRLLVENSHDLMATINLEGQLLYHSPSLERILGYSPKEVEKSNILQYVHPEDVESTRTALNQHQKTVTARYRHRDGNYVWLEICGSRYHLPTGEVHVVLIARDISYRKRSEQALIDSENRYRKLVEESFLIPWEADPVTAQFLYVGPQARRLLGYRVESWFQADFIKRLIHPADASAFREHFQQNKSTESEFSFECRAFHAEGHPIWIRFLVTVIRNEEEPLVLRGVLFEITERKQAEVLVAGQKRVLEQVATGLPLDEILSTILEHVQQQIPQVCPFFLSMDSQTDSLQFAVGLQIPPKLKAFWQKISLTSSTDCFSQTARQQTLIATSRTSDSPFWNLPDTLADEASIEAIWAQPILSRDGKVLGVLGCLSHQPDSPTPQQVQILNGASYLAGVAIERSLMDEALKTSTERLRTNNATLVKLAQSDAIRYGDLGSALRELTSAAALGCHTDRASIWLFEKAFANLRCVEVCQLNSEPADANITLTSVDHASFILALDNERVIVASDALTDARTSELRQTYLDPHDIRSLLSAAIRVRGEVIGFLCLEQIGLFKHWTQEDELFAGSLADIVSLALQSDEQRRAEEALRISEERYRSVVDSLAEGVMLTEPDGRIATFNASATRILGLKPEDLKNRQMGDPAFTAIKEDGTPFPIHEFPSVHSLRTGKPTNDITMGVLRPDGSLIWISTSTRPLALDPEGKLQRVVISFIDITEKRRSAEALRRAHDDLEHRVEVRTAELRNAIRELSDFAYIITHDLKAPLRAVGNLSDWLAKDYLDKLGNDGAGLFQLLRDRVKHMHNLIDGILAYTRIGRTQEGDIDVDLQSLLLGVVQSLAPLPSFQIELATNLPVVRGIRTQMQQIFQNLIDNAIKHHDRPDGQVRVIAERQEGAWLFKIADDGPGIHPRYHEKIFKIFQRLGTEETAHGAGIGLALVKRTVEARGGRIWIESEIGKGSTFYFIWPDIPAAPSPVVV